MSNRSRRRSSGSYTARLQRRGARTQPRRPGGSQLRRIQGALTRSAPAPWLLTVVTVVAEAGHLAAAFGQWREATAVAVYHLVAASLLGLVAAAVSGPAGVRVLAAGMAVAASGPVLWGGGVLLGTSPYRELALAVAAGTAVAEVTVVALLLVAWRARTRRLPTLAAPQPTRTGVS